MVLQKILMILVFEKGFIFSVVFFIISTVEFILIAEFPFILYDGWKIFVARILFCETYIPTKQKTKTNNMWFSCTYEDKTWS